MPTYLFYPYLPTGASLVFNEASLPDLAAAELHALALLEEHMTAGQVEIWEGDILRGTVRRPPAR